ncbi:MAG: dihydroorotate dehydrogenase-like protein [Oceanipulchritudo sp.]
MDLSVSYLGLNLRNPFLVGACPLVYKLESVQELEAGGAAGIVMHSLFEEQIARGNGHDRPHFMDNKGTFKESGAFPLSPENYLQHLRLLKRHLGIPVIASLNGVRPGSWIAYARHMEEAGADAIELNLYLVPSSDTASSSEIEKNLLDIVEAVGRQLSIPLAVKISPFFSGLPRFVKRLEESGVDALVLFNSFIQPDIDIENVCYQPNLKEQESHSLLLRTHWIATLHGRTRLDLSLNGGIQSPEDAVKGLMAGATSIQLVSFLLSNGPRFMRFLLDAFEEWMEVHGYTDIDQIQGLLSFSRNSNTEAGARDRYLRTLQSWKNP